MEQDFLCSLYHDRDESGLASTPLNGTVMPGTSCEEGKPLEKMMKTTKDRRGFCSLLVNGYDVAAVQPNNQKTLRYWTMTIQEPLLTFSSKSRLQTLLKV